jgi:hypothetical protein
VFLVLAAIELIIVTKPLPPGSGANIGLPFAMFAVLASEPVKESPQRARSNQQTRLSGSTSGLDALATPDRSVLPQASEGCGVRSDPQQRVVGDGHPEADHHRLLDSAHRQMPQSSVCA